MKYWNLHDAIAEQVQKESLEEWAHRAEPILPQQEKPAKVKLTTLIRKLIKINLYELRP